MTAAGASVVFFITWWLFFFMALPFGVRPEREPEPGTVPSAPARPRLWLKALAATLLAGALTLGLDWALDRELISLRPDVRP